MILVLDVGNSNITMGAYNGEELLFVSRFATNSTNTSDEYSVKINGVLQLNGYSKEDVTDAIIGSVVPSVGRILFSSLMKLGVKNPLVLGPGVKTGLNIKIDNPAELGADLVAGAVGVINNIDKTCLIIDLGTATTISVVTPKAEFLGCTISAGILSTLRALTGSTAQLHDITIQQPTCVVGTNTGSSMRSGLILGAAAMLDGLIDRMKQELGEEVCIVATGGFAHTIVANCKYGDEITIDDELVLKGLLKIYNKNR